MFTDKLRTVKMFGVAAIALLMMCSGVFILAGGENDAETVNIGGTDYTYAEVSVAPDYKWQYTVEFPDDLDAETKLYVDGDHTDSFIADQLSTLGTADRTINLNFTGASAGEEYTLVLKAVHTPSEQTTYQAIRFTVVEGMSITPTSGALGTNFVIGDSGADAYTYTITTAIGKIQAEEISVKINGVDATFTPTKVSDTQYTVKVTADTATAGKKTVVVTAANDLGEDATSTTTYIVYDELIAENITVKGYEASSWNLVPAQTGTKDATFDVIATAVLYDEMSGITLYNYTTTMEENVLTRTGAPDSCIDRAFVLTLRTNGMVGHAEQEKTVYIHVYDEPDFTLSPINTEITTYNKMTPETITFSASKDTLTKTWSITPTTGLTLTGDGETRSVTVDKDTPTGTYTVKVTTPSGQEETATIVIDHEDDFTISGLTSLNPVVTGSASNVEVRTFNYTISPEDFPSSVTWSIKSNSEAGVDANIVDGVLSLKSASPVKNVMIVLHAETACGNYADLEVTVNFYNVLSFNAPPTTGAYAYATNADNE